MTDTLESIKEEIEKAQAIVIAGHTSPDGDAIGSCQGLALSIKAMGKQVTVLLEEYLEKFKILPGNDLVRHEDYDSLSPDLFIVLDCGDAARLGKAEALFQKCQRTACIDHHISNVGFAHLNYVDVDASSTAELVYRLIQTGLPLNQQAACCLYGGMMTDTGGFRHTCTSPDTMRAVADLMEYNIPFSDIYNELFSVHKYTEARVLARAIEKTRLLFQERLAVAVLSKEDIVACGSNSKELDGIAEYLKNIHGVAVSALIYEKKENEVKISFRSDDTVNVCQIAVALGGGGHVKAAGCTLYTDLKTAADKALLLLKEQLISI